MNRVVVARSDGRGGLRIPVPKSHRESGNYLHIAGKKYKITTDGRVNIPKSIMDAYGTTNSDGRKVLSLDIGYRHDDDQLKTGAYINELKHPEGYKTGDTVQDAEYDLDDFVIHPETDAIEYYT